ncbi:MAG: hypothetical protein ACYCR3_09380 [Acidithiobacillus sp.]
MPSAERIPAVNSSSKNEGRAAKAHLAAGRPIYCGDERYPGMVIKSFRMAASS